MAVPKTFTAGERLFAVDLNDNFDDLDVRDTLSVKSNDVDDAVVLTQAAYDALTPDARTLYLITE